MLVEETPKEKRKKKKQRSPELEEGTHLVGDVIIRHIKGFLQIDLSLLFVFVGETPKEKRKRKKQKSRELEEGTHDVAEPFLFCKTKVVDLIMMAYQAVLRN